MPIGLKDLPVLGRLLISNENRPKLPVDHSEESLV